MRSSAEMFEQIDKCIQQLELGKSIYPGMTYEEGVEAALRWVMDETDDLPVDLNDIDAE